MSERFSLSTCKLRKVTWTVRELGLEHKVLQLMMWFYGGGGKKILTIAYLSPAVQVVEFYCFLTVDWRETNNPAKEIKTRVKKGNHPIWSKVLWNPFTPTLDWIILHGHWPKKNYIYVYIYVSRIHSSVSQIISASHGINPQPWADFKSVFHKEPITLVEKKDWLIDLIWFSN